MTFIRRIPNPIIITPNQEPQTEVTQQSQPQPQTSFGVAGTADLFESASPSNFNFLEQPSQSVEQSQPSTTPDMTVDASSVFSFFDVAPLQLNSSLQELLDRLNPLKEKRQELMTQIEDVQEKILKAEEALSKMMEALNSDKPIPDEVQALLGQLGILGIIGGLPAIPIIGGLMGMFGLSEDYKQQAKKAIAEMTRQMGDLKLNSAQLQQQLEEVNQEIESVVNDIKEKQRSFQSDLSFTSEMVAEQPWQEFVDAQDLIQKENNPFDVGFNTMVQQKDDEQ